MPTSIPIHFHSSLDYCRNAVERRGKFSAQGMARGNERRRWHGTPQDHCKLLGRTIPRGGRTSDRRCAICSIANTGFRQPGHSRGVQRFIFARVCTRPILILHFTGLESGCILAQPHPSTWTRIYIIWWCAYGIFFRSDDYTNRVNGQPTPKKGRRAILLCKVVIGRTAKLRAMNSQLRAPPQGFHSVRSLSQFHPLSDALR